MYTVEKTRLVLVLVAVLGIVSLLGCGRKTASMIRYAPNAAPTPTRPPLPPLPTYPSPSATPEPSPTTHLSEEPKKHEGGKVTLSVQFPQDWPWYEIDWHDLWTVVQWQDDYGNWHDVDGWQGGLDEVSEGIGQKAWWFGEDLLGQGPFRWLIYREQEGVLLAQSQAFYLPDQTGGALSVSMSVMISE